MRPEVKMKYDLEANGAKKTYRLVVKGDLLYIKAHNINQAISMAKKSGYQVLSAAKWVD